MWNEQDFCNADDGFDYIFTKMNAIYGATFANHWREVDPDIIRQTWKEQCWIGLTYRPKMDYALEHMNPDRPPSALAFAKLLIDGPEIPPKPLPLLTKQQTEDEIRVIKENKEKAVAKLGKLLADYKKWKSS